MGGFITFVVIVGVAVALARIRVYIGRRAEEARAEREAPRRESDR